MECHPLSFLVRFSPSAASFPGASCPWWMPKMSANPHASPHEMMFSELPSRPAPTMHDDGCFYVVGKYLGAAPTP